eukprot:GHVS01053008.1.p2 GENE.GHVS01053008.1~~GHVS01053008.1.p2  ORF type:complete len:136 (-),score=17.23 GHVS01053008.1:471-878(-)
MYIHAHMFVCARRVCAMETTSKVTRRLTHTQQQQHLLKLQHIIRTDTTRVHTYVCIYIKIYIHVRICTHIHMQPQTRTSVSAHVHKLTTHKHIKLHTNNSLTQTTTENNINVSLHIYLNTVRPTTDQQEVGFLVG